MKTKDILIAVVAVVLLLWLGGVALGIIRHALHLAIRLTVIGLLILAAIHFLTPRR